VNCCVACQNIVRYYSLLSNSYPYVPTSTICLVCLRAQTNYLQPFCATSFRVPSDRECHIRLTQAAPPTLPTPVPMPSGIMALYLFTITTGGALNATYPVYPTSCPFGVVPSGVFPWRVSLACFPRSRPLRRLSIRSRPLRRLPFRHRSPNIHIHIHLTIHLPIRLFQPLRRHNRRPGRLPDRVRVEFSNGPCGEFGVWPIPVGDGEGEDGGMRM
jgi:hypothetical protein